MKTTKWIPVVLFALAACIVSCKKDQVTYDLDNDSINDEAISSFVEKSVQADEEAATMRGGNSLLSAGCNWQELLPECAIVTESGDNYPRTITIDYGTGCTNTNGITKQGMIIIETSDDMLNAGATRIVTFENYYVNNTQIEGSRTTTNIGNNVDSHPVFSRIVQTTIT
ncbi:MAG: hypothetical protein ABUL44_02610, partial [Flavobacterium sp.]